MPHIEISNGEFIDRLSILDIKMEKIEDSSQKMYVDAEYAALVEQSRVMLDNEKLRALYFQLRALNLRMWNSMQRIYDWESPINEEYVNLVVLIIQVNMERARVKKSIDETTNSNMREAKTFFQPGDVLP